MSLPIDPSFTTVGGEWAIGGLQQPTAPAPGGKDFGGVLGNEISKIAASQNDAAIQSQALATGQATDPAEVVMAVEKARLEMQLATTLRNKGTEAIQELMRTQV